jgi:hydroxymethylbilane synthase
LERLGRAADAGATLGVDEMVPAPGQGALAVEARADDEPVLSALAAIDDPPSHTRLRAERALTRALDASCHTPIGAHAGAIDGQLEVLAFVGLPDGSAWVRDRLAGDAGDPEALGRAVAERLLAAGAGDLLRAAEAAATPAERRIQVEGHGPPGS